jgi:hypothetical protein
VSRFAALCDSKKPQPHRLAARIPCVLARTRLCDAQRTRLGGMSPAGHTLSTPARSTGGRDLAMEGHSLLDRDRLPFERLEYGFDE